MSGDDIAESIDAQHAAIRREYRIQADAWGRRPIDTHLAWVVEQATWRPGWQVIDVAAGTGLFARAIAARVASVVAVDLTPEMLTRGRALARAQGLANVRFEQGAAERLPFPDASFDAVVTRYSIHHFRAPALALREMARVCRLGGQLVVVDMIADDDSAVADRHNELERMADRTHTTILPPLRLIAEVVDAGFTLDTYLSREVDMVFDEWQPQLPANAPERQAIRAALEGELAGRGETGMRPTVRDGALLFRHTWGIVIAHRRPLHGKPRQLDIAGARRGPTRLCGDRCLHRIDRARLRRGVRRRPQPATDLEPLGVGGPRNLNASSDVVAVSAPARRHRIPSHPNHELALERLSDCRRRRRSDEHRHEEKHSSLARMIAYRTDARA